MKRVAYVQIIFEITQVLKGSLKPNEKIKITLFGGYLNGKKSFVLEDPNFEKNQRSILFLNEKEHKVPEVRSLYVYGRSQGKFNIIKSQIGNEDYVYRDHHTSPLSLMDSYQTVSITNKEGIEINNFLSLILQYLSE